MKFLKLILPVVFVTSSVALPAGQKSTAAKKDSQSSNVASKTNINAFVAELLKDQARDGQTDVAMWLPTELFVEMRAVKGRQSREEIENELAVLKPYVILLVQRQVEKPDGSASTADEQEIRKHAEVMLPGGKKVKP